MKPKQHTRKLRSKAAHAADHHDLLGVVPEPKTRTNYESKLQQACVRWFRSQYPHHERLLFAIPNGGKRSVITAAILKAEGARAGTADLFLSIPRHGFHGFYIEMKVGKNELSSEQEQFKLAVEKHTYRHRVIWTQDEFIREVNFYLAGDRTTPPERRPRPTFPGPRI